MFLLAVCNLCCCADSPEEKEVSGAVVKVQPASKQEQGIFPRGKIIGRIPCLSDTLQSFALYIPLGKATPMPVVYLFDPHGDGTFPLGLYRPLADRFHFVLVGSNNSKNGNDWQTAQFIIHLLLSEVSSRLQVDGNRLYTAGFSGGAKVAVYAALHQPAIRGVIAAGAGIPEGETLNRTDFSFTGIAGRGDMNMTDLVALNTELDGTRLRHRLILFDGKHAWPPAPVMETALMAFQFDAMRDGTSPPNDSLLAAYTDQSRKRTEAEVRAYKLLEAEQETALSAVLLQGLPPYTTWFVQKEALLKKDPLFSRQQAAAQQIFAIEQQKKQTFQQQLQQGDLQYWGRTIQELKSGTSLPGGEGAMNQRLIAYLSLAFYSVSNQLINHNQSDIARFYVALYKLADPTNTEAWYFSALLNAKANQQEAAENDLRQAAALGFTDSARLLQEPALQRYLPVLRKGARKAASSK